MEITYPGAVAPDRTRFVRSLGLKIHLHEWGDPAAPPIVCTHGFADHGRVYDLLAPILADAGHRVIAMDSRGHGDSDRPDAYEWLPEVLDLVQVLRELDEPAHVVGHSRGGGQAIDAVVTYPSGVKKLVNLDGFGPPSDDGFEVPGRPRVAATAPEHMATWLDWRRTGAKRETFRPYASLEAMAARRKEQNPRLSDEWLLHFAATGSRRTEDGWVWKVDPLAGRGMGPFRPDWIAPNWRKLRVPMLAVIGSEPDSWGPLPEPLLSSRLSHVPQLERAVVQDAGHFVHIEQPEATARIILDYLGDGA
jgi:pimeloyl-ACP methyl ester carboxylesterase